MKLRMAALWKAGSRSQAVSFIFADVPCSDGTDSWHLFYWFYVNLTESWLIPKENNTVEAEEAASRRRLPASCSELVTNVASEWLRQPVILPDPSCCGSVKFFHELQVLRSIFSGCSVIVSQNGPHLLHFTLCLNPSHTGRNIRQTVPCCVQPYHWHIRAETTQEKPQTGPRASAESACGCP